MVPLWKRRNHPPDMELEEDCVGRPGNTFMISKPSYVLAPQMPIAFRESRMSIKVVSELETSSRHTMHSFSQNFNV